MPHTSYPIDYHCIPVGGAMSSLPAASVVGFYDYTVVAVPVRDHREKAERPRRFWLEKSRAP